MTKIHRRRLEKLANHLLTGKLGHKKFDFSVINTDEHTDNPKPYTCGTNGCAIGEMPIVWPRRFRFSSGSDIRDITLKEDKTSFYIARSFFGISEPESYKLFDPDYIGSLDEPAPWNRGRLLTHTATRTQVGKAILRFLAWKEKGGVLD